MLEGMWELQQGNEFLISFRLQFGGFPRYAKQQCYRENSIPGTRGRSVCEHQSLGDALQQQMPN